MYKYIYSLLFAMLIFSGSGNAQPTKNIKMSFHVDGVCKMCKARIENAAYIKGVKFVEWDKDTQTIQVVYNSQKTTPEAIHKSIAMAGHSTEKMKADSTAYKKLPACCAYDDGVEVH